MFEDLIKNTKDEVHIKNIENINFKLYEEKSWVGLGWLFRIVSREFFKDSFKSSKKERVIPIEIVDNTLNYLKPLLEKKELIVGRCFYNKILNCHPVVEYQGTLEETLQAIRDEWLGADTPQKQWEAEFFIAFSLPTKSWRVYEDH